MGRFLYYFFELIDALDSTLLKLDVGLSLDRTSVSAPWSFRFNGVTCGRYFNAIIFPNFTIVSQRIKLISLIIGLRIKPRESAYYIHLIATITILSNASLKLRRWVVIGRLIKGTEGPEKGTKNGRGGTGARGAGQGNVMEMTHRHFHVFVFDYPFKTIFCRVRKLMKAIYATQSVGAGFYLNNFFYYFFLKPRVFGATAFYNWNGLCVRFFFVSEGLWARVMFWG